jgi:XTP/dITP diphosphohydrolase
MKLIFATHNEGKLREMKNILADLPLEIISASEAGVLEEPVEDGETFADNALIKAKYVSDRVGEWTVADDSGLCVEALGGAPGVFSARWAGEGATGEDKANKVLKELGETPMDRRGAYFESSLALVSPQGEHWIFSGRINGKITFTRQELIARPKLPYDAIFIPEGHEKTFGQMTDEEKNALSHRGQAFRDLKVFLLSGQVNIDKI